MAREGRLPVNALQGAARTQDRGHRLIGDVLVLGRERIDAGGDDPDTRLIEPIPGVSGSREHASGRLGDKRPQKVPDGAGEVIRFIDSDVRTPHHLDASRPEAWDQARGLRVMQDRDVAGADQASQPFRVARGRFLVNAALARGERSTVGLHAVKLRVDLLGGVEKIR